VTECPSDKTYCCGSMTQSTCCASNEKFALAATIGVASSSTSLTTASSSITPSSATTSSQLTAAGTSSSSSTPTAASTSKSSGDLTKLAIGLGIGFGIPILLAIAIVGYFLGRRKYAKTDYHPSPPPELSGGEVSPSSDFIYVGSPVNEKKAVLAAAAARETAGTPICKSPSSISLILEVLYRIV